MPALLSLDTLDLNAISQAGRKAATLGALKRAGFAVPDGHVLDADWYAAWTHDALDTDALRASVRLALAELGPGLLAVRSSGVAEDGDGRSMAGCFDSTLGVQGEDAAVQAVIACYTSALRARSDLQLDAGGMAALIQRQVNPQAAGVAFTADPVTGARDVVCIEAVAGLAEELMAGTVDGERWRVVDAAQPEGMDAAVLTPAQATEIARVARSIERELGAPSDVEWALVDGEVVILQARPITALPAPPVPIVDEDPEGFWQRDDHCPNPTPLTWDIWYEKYPAQLSEVIKSAGVPLEGMVARKIRGQTYMRMETGAPDGPPPPGPVLWLVSRLLPSMRKSERMLGEFLRENRAMAIIDEWVHEVEPALSARVRELQAVALEGLTDEGLLEHLGRCEKLIEDSGFAHAKMGVAFMIPMGRLYVFCEDYLGWSDAETSELVAGYSPGTTQVDRELAEIASPWADDPRLHAGGWHEVRAALPELAEAVDAWFEWGGQRRTDYEISTKLLCQCPDLVLSRLRASTKTLTRLDRNRSEGRAGGKRRMAMARQALSVQRFAELEERVANARRASHSRDANALVSVHLSGATLRHAVVELGRRMEARDQLDAAVHAFFVRPREWRAALEGADLGDTVARRRGEHSWALANPGPETFGTRPVEPDPTWFPPNLCLTFRMFSRMDDPLEVEGEGIVGLAAGGGVAEGTVRLLRSPEELHRLNPGDILVCECTGASWAMAFGIAGAIVTDRGGWMSHPAILAREYGLPAVLGTHKATRTLVDGQRVRVDGRTGRVEIL